jgi:DNA-binding IclR family transcriptional regulator
MAIVEDPDRYRAPALDKGLDILELLAAVDEGLTQADIAKRLDRSPNEFYRMLDRLVKRGYVVRQDGDRYALTLKLFGLAHFHAPIRRLVSFATPIMREFSSRMHQACHLAVFDRGHVVVIAQQESPTYWGMSIRVGARISLYNTGSGHVLMAFRSEQDREMMMAEYLAGSEDQKKPEHLDRRIKDIVERGYETMDSMQTAGIRNVSAPVIAPDGQAIAALTCPYIRPINTANAPTFEDVIAQVVSSANELSDRACGRGEDVE